MQELAKNYLFAGNKIIIYQDPNMFSFSLDTVLLANFAKVKKTDRICDFGTNNAAIPMMLAAKGHIGDVVGVEIQDRAVKIANKNIETNGFENIKIVKSDIYEYAQQNAKNKFDAIYCNPPFFKDWEMTNKNDSEFKTIARHEVKITLEKIIESAARLLENKGKFFMVHRSERVAEIIYFMKKNKIEPKRLRFVQAKNNKDVSTVLVEGSFVGNAGIKIMQNIIAHKDSGEYSDEIIKMFELGDNND